ncbi:MAG: hypothetical protein AAF368_15960, partial [Planctomycetota bacterium]
HASGLVLVTDLELIVDEDPTAGAVRVQAIRGNAGNFVHDADVRVVGSQDGFLHRGETDPRGIYSTAGMQGRATVIARSGERMYAFHRGEVFLGRDNRSNDRRVRERAPLAPPQEIDYLGNTAVFNSTRQQQRGQELQQAIDRKSLGVQVQSVK